MKFADIRVGMKLYDTWAPVQKRGVVTEVLKTKFRIQFHGDDEPTEYDRAHAQFCEPTFSQKWKLK